MRLNKVSTLLFGALAITTSAAIVPAASWRPPATGTWNASEPFPDPAAERGPTLASAWDPAWAANDHVVKVFAEGLNKVAANSAVGTILAVQLEPPIGGRIPAICVRY